MIVFDVVSNICFCFYMFDIIAPPSQSLPDLNVLVPVHEVRFQMAIAAINVKKNDNFLIIVFFS